MAEQMAVSELVPQLAFPKPLEEALATADTFSQRLVPLQAQAKTIEVKDAETYAQIGSVLSEVRSIRKNEIVPLWSPFFGVVDRVRDFLKQNRQKAENLCEEIDSVCRQKMKVYEFSEKQAAQKEQAKLNRNKPEDAQVAVKPNVPAVTGYRQSTVYRAVVEDRAKFLNAFLRAKPAEKKFLAQFIVIDEKELSAYYRREKEKAVKIAGVSYHKE